jgi:hypothetical protein
MEQEITGEMAEEILKGDGRGDPMRRWQRRSRRRSQRRLTEEICRGDQALSQQ